MKKLKYVLIALAVIVLCVGGYIVYELKFKSYDIADPEVDALTEEKFEVELPDGEVIVVDKDGNIVENKPSNTKKSNSSGIVATQTPDSNAGGESASSSEVPTPGNDNDSSDESINSNGKKVTVSTIKEKYKGTFNQLENQSRDRLNTLITQAANEYSTKKSNGEAISYGYFYRKYMNAAKSIESATDSTVYVVIGLVEKDLQANGFDKSYAQSFAKDYEGMKESLRNELMSKALNYK